jgi:uncharacterized protein with GYD domain
MKYVTLIKLSDEGRKRFPEADKLFVAAVEVTEKLGGKVLETYALAGKYDFLSISDYPTPEIAFEARIKLTEMGIFDTLEGFEAFDMGLFLSKV